MEGPNLSLLICKTHPSEAGGEEEVRSYVTLAYTEGQIITSFFPSFEERAYLAVPGS